MTKKIRVSQPLKLIALSMALSFACIGVQAGEAPVKGDRGLSLRSSKAKKLPAQKSVEKSDPDLWAMQPTEYDEPSFDSEPLATYHASDADNVYPSQLLYNEDNPSQTRLSTADEPAATNSFSKKGLKLRRRKQGNTREEAKDAQRDNNQVDIYTPYSTPVETIVPELPPSSLYDPTAPLLPLLDSPASAPSAIESPEQLPILPLVEPVTLPPLLPLEPTATEKEDVKKDVDDSSPVDDAFDKYLNVITDNPYHDEEIEEEPTKPAVSPSQERQASQEKPAPPQEQQEPQEKQEAQKREERQEPPAAPSQPKPPAPQQEPEQPASKPQPRSAAPQQPPATAEQPERQIPREPASPIIESNNSLQNRELEKVPPPRPPQPPAQPSRHEVEDYRQRLEVRLLERYNNLPNYAGNVGRVEVVLSKPIEQSLDGSRLRAEFDQLVYDPWGRRIPKLEEEYFVVTFAAGGARQVRADPSIRVGLDHEKSYSEKMPLNADPFGKVQQSKAFSPEQRPAAAAKKMPDWWRPDFPELQ